MFVCSQNVLHVYLPVLRVWNVQVSNFLSVYYNYLNMLFGMFVAFISFNILVINNNIRVIYFKYFNFTVFVIYMKVI